MTLTHSGALIPEIVRRGFQDLLEAVGEAFSEGFFRPLPALNSMNAALMSGPPTATATASGYSPPR